MVPPRFRLRPEVRRLTGQTLRAVESAGFGTCPTTVTTERSAHFAGAHRDAPMGAGAAEVAGIPLSTDRFCI